MPAPMPRDYVMALVSGFPSRERANRWMMIIQAVVDDSQTNARRSSRVFALGGLLASAEQWGELADAWAVELDRGPRLAYFKLNEALAMKGEFHPDRGWTEAQRDAKLGSFAKILKTYVAFSVIVSIDAGDYENLVKPLAARAGWRELRDPYFLCFYQITDAITSMRSEFPDATGLDYIFDDQGVVGLHAARWWKQLSVVMPWRNPTDLGSTPIHRNDVEFKPLQAADLYAGLKRLQFERNGVLWSTPASALAELSGLRGWHHAYTWDDLNHLAATITLKRAARLR